MFRIMQQDILLQDTLRKDGKEYRIENLSRSGNGQEIILRLRGVSDGAFSQTLREVARDYTVDDNGLELPPPKLATKGVGHLSSGKSWVERVKRLPRRLIGKPTPVVAPIQVIRTDGQIPFQLHLDQIWACVTDWVAKNHRLLLEACINPRVLLQKDNHGQPMANPARFLKLDVLRSLAILSEKDMLNEIRGRMESDRRTWEPLKTSAFSATSIVQVGADFRLPSLLSELHIAWAEAHSACTSMFLESIDFKPYLAMAMERYWAVVLKHISTARVLKEALLPGQQLVQVKIFKGQKSPDQGVQEWPAATGQATCALVQKESGTTMKVKIFFEAPYSSARDRVPYATNISVAMGITLNRPEGLLKQLNKLLSQFLSDIDWSLGVFFKNHLMVVYRSFGLVFQDLQEFKNWLPQRAEKETEEKIRMLWKNFHRGTIMILDKSSRAAIINTMAHFILQFPQPHSK